MAEDNYVVLLGLKRNGRFVKNEEYSLGDFTKFVTPAGVMMCKTPSFMTRLGWLFNGKAATFALTEERKKTIESCKGSIVLRIRTEIDKDEFGKKK